MLNSSNLTIKTSYGKYNVKIGNKIIEERNLQINEIWIIDTNVASLHDERLVNDSILQEALEEKKSLDSVSNLIQKIRRKGGNRDTVIIGVGGGIIQDLSTFVASCYMRGVDWVYYPTTLLGMVDSCIGGKSSINAGRYKNIIGNFYPPIQVIIDTNFCATLSNEQIVDGLFEAAKISYAHSHNSFNKYLSLVGNHRLPREEDALSAIIEHSLSKKKVFIEKDEFDKGIRLKLNFGHTFAHAIEGATSYKISHGVAVGLGMLAAAKFSIRLGLIDKNQGSIYILENHIRALLKYVPTALSEIATLDCYEAINFLESDKKHLSDHYTFVLLNHAGELETIQLEKSSANKELILLTFKDLRRTINEI